jgi:hypothetical protein
MTPPACTNSRKPRGKLRLARSVRLVAKVGIIILPHVAELGAEEEPLLAFLVESAKSGDIVVTVDGLNALDTNIACHD